MMHTLHNDYILGFSNIKILHGEHKSLELSLEPQIKHDNFPYIYICLY